ncbi:MAG: GntR family transcriptional regulator [Pararhizobium sp.]
MTDDAIFIQLSQMAASAVPGEKVPSVRSLMKEFGRSQLLVQRALTRLKDEGLIHMEVGRGTFFSGLSGATHEVKTEFRGRSLLLLRRTVAIANSRLVLDKVSERLSSEGQRVLEVAYTDAEHALAVLRGLPRFDACIMQASFETISLETLTAAKAKAHHLILHGLGLTGTAVDCCGYEWGESLSGALRVLNDRGHVNVGLAMSNFPNMTRAIVRKRFAQYCADNSLQLEDALMEIPHLPHQGYQEALVQAIAERRQGGRLPFTALICWGVESGAWFRKVLQTAGIRVPQDLSVVLLGHPDMANEHDEFFSIMGSSASEQVAGLCNLVNWRWQNPEEQPATILLDGETALRESSLGRPKP